MTKSNDDIPADELLLAEAIAAAKANGMDWCEGTLFVDRNGFHLDAHGKTIGQIRQAAYGCCALGALYLAGHQNGFARTFDESVTLGNDYERNWFGDTAAPDGETLMDVDASAESLGWAFRCAMTQESPLSGESDEPGSEPHQMAERDAAFIAAARSAVPALIEECERLQTKLGHEREHSKMLSDSNSALFIEKARVEDFCAKVRGQYTEAHAQVTRLASALAEAERGRDAYRAMVADLLASAHPYPTEHPTMAAQWKRARDLLKNGPRKEAGQ